MNYDWSYYDVERRSIHRSTSTCIASMSEKNCMNNQGDQNGQSGKGYKGKDTSCDS